MFVVFLKSPVHNCVTTIALLGMKPKNAGNHVVGRKTARPATSRLTITKASFSSLTQSPNTNFLLIQEWRSVSYQQQDLAHTHTHTHKKPGLPLLAATSSHIRIYRTRKIMIHFASNIYQWDLLVANVTCLLVRANFLQSNSQLVDIKRNKYRIISNIGTPKK